MDRGGTGAIEAVGHSLWALAASSRWIIQLGSTLFAIRLDFIEMLTERRKQLQVTIVELSIWSPRTITSPDFAMAFDDYRKMRDEIAAVVNNFDVPGRLVPLELHKTALLRAKT